MQRLCLIIFSILITLFIFNNADASAQQKAFFGGTQITKNTIICTVKAPLDCAIKKH